jgi:hypothetical protein
LHDLRALAAIIFIHLLLPIILCSSYSQDTHALSERLTDFQVLSHSSLLLDAHTPLFVSYPPSHSLLARLQQAIEPLLTLQADYRALRAPLDAALILAKREEQRQKERERKREIQAGANGSTVTQKDIGVQWINGVRVSTGRQGLVGKSGLGGRSMGMGEEKVGKWKVEDIVF